MYSLRMSFCTVPESLPTSAPVALGDGDVEREQDGGGGVDGHRGGDLFKGDAVEEPLHVFDGIDGDADFADFAEGEGVVGVDSRSAWADRRRRRGRWCRCASRYL